MAHPEVTPTTAFQRELYPENCNADGVPYERQKGEQAVKGYVDIIDRMTLVERADFEEFRAAQQALLDANQDQEEDNVLRTKASPTGLQLPRACRQQQRFISPSVRRMRRAQVGRAHRTHAYPHARLHLDLHIGSVLMGIAISAVCVAWIPQIEPMLRRLVVEQLVNPVKRNPNRTYG